MAVEPLLASLLPIGRRRTRRDFSSAPGFEQLLENLLDISNSSRVWDKVQLARRVWQVASSRRTDWTAEQVMVLRAAVKLIDLPDSEFRAHHEDARKLNDWASEIVLNLERRGALFGVNGWHYPEASAERRTTTVVTAPAVDSPPPSERSGALASLAAPDVQYVENILDDVFDILGPPPAGSRVERRNVGPLSPAHR